MAQVGESAIKTEAADEYTTLDLDVVPIRSSNLGSAIELGTRGSILKANKAKSGAHRRPKAKTKAKELNQERPSSKSLSTRCSSDEAYLMKVTLGKAGRKSLSVYVTEHVDETSGQKYYASSSGKTAWTKQELYELEKTAAEPTSAQPISSVKEGLKKFWETFNSDLVTMEHTDNRNIIPMHELLSMLVSVKRTKVLRDAFNFLLLVSLMIIAAFSTHNQGTAFKQTTGIMDLFLDEEFPDISIYKNYFDIMTHEEFWQWTEGVLNPGLYAGEEWYSGAPTGTEKPSILNTLGMLGSLQIRQVRINENGDEFSTKVFRPLSASKHTFLMPGTFTVTEGNTSAVEVSGMDLKQFGALNTVVGEEKVDVWRSADENMNFSIYYFPDDDTSKDLKQATVKFKSWNGTTQTFEMETPWTHSNASRAVIFCANDFKWNRETETRDNIGGYVYQPDKFNDLYGKKSFGGDYGDGAYQIEVNAKLGLVASTAIFRKLKSETWTDNRTRVVAFDFNLFNNVTRYVTAFRLKVEVFDSGRFVPSHTIFTFKPIPLGEKRTFMFTCYTLFAIVLLYQLVREGQMLWRFRSALHLLLNVRSFMVLGFLVLNFFTVALFLMSATQENFRNFFTKTLGNENFQTLFEAGKAQKVAFQFASSIMVFSCLNIFRAFSLTARGRILWLTFLNSVNDLFIYVMVLGLFFYSFALAAYWSYGDQVENFHSLQKAVSSVSRWMLGDFDYNALTTANPEYSFVVFASFQVIIVIFSLNIIIAVLVEAYETVCEENEKLEGMWHDLVPAIHHSLWRECKNALRSMLFFWAPSRSVPKILRPSPKLKLERKFQKELEKAQDLALLSESPTNLLTYYSALWRTLVDDSGEDKHEAHAYYVTLASFAEVIGREDVAKSVFAHYRNLKDTVLISAKSAAYTGGFAELSGSTRQLIRKMYRSEEVATAGSERALKTTLKFYCQRVTSSNRKVKRLVGIDRHNLDLCVWSLGNVLKRRIPVSRLLSVERTKTRDGARLRLVFSVSNSDRIYEKPYLDLRFLPARDSVLPRKSILTFASFSNNDDEADAARGEALKFRELLLEAANLERKARSLEKKKSAGKLTKRRISRANYARI